MIVVKTTGGEQRCRRIFTPSNGQELDSLGLTKPSASDCCQYQQNNAELQNYTVSAQLDIPYSGKFSHGAKFRVFRGLVSYRENKNRETLNLQSRARARIRMRACDRASASSSDSEGINSIIMALFDNVAVH